MALTLGTDTYVTLTDANTYWADRNNSSWSSASDADKEKALREATQFIDSNYEFIGLISDIDQTLAWPRSGAVIQGGNFHGVTFDSDEYPRFLTEAVSELALDALSARLRPSQERAGLVKKQKVDAIEVEYSDYAPSHKTYDFVTSILSPLTTGSKGSIKLVRS